VKFRYLIKEGKTKKYLRAVPFVVLLCCSFACQGKAVMAELEKYRAQATVEEKNKEIVNRFFEEFNKGNLEIFNELCSPDYRLYSPSDNPKPMSREAQIEAEKMARSAFPDLSLRIEKLFAAGDSVIIWGIATGTHQGEFQGIQPTGNKIEFGNIILMSLKNGKIVEAREEPNMLRFKQQLGMELKPKEVKK